MIMSITFYSRTQARRCMYRSHGRRFLHAHNRMPWNTWDHNDFCRKVDCILHPKIRNDICQQIRNDKNDICQEIRNDKK